MKFGPPEYFAIMLLALTMVGSLSTESPLKGAYSLVLLGLLLAVVGADVQTGQIRFTFGSDDLMDGINFIVVAIGMFGVTVVMQESERVWRSGFKLPRDKIKGAGLWITWSELKESFMPYIGGTVIGFATGVLPGIGGMTATLLTYGFEKQISKHPEKFGERGNRRGCSGRGIQQCQQWGEYGAFDDTWYTGVSLPLPCGRALF